MLHLQPETSPAPAMPKLRPLALIVDADTNARRLCRMVLEDLGYEIQEIDTGVAAIATVRVQIPDVILLGRQLRDVSGQEAGQWFQSMPPLRLTPIVVLSRAGEPGPVLSGMAHAVYLHAPLSAGSLRRSIQTLLQN